jgi:hypothetical protein
MRERLEKSGQLTHASNGSQGMSLLNGAAFTKRTSLILSEQLTIDLWCRIGKHILNISDSTAWWIGDWLVFGEERYSDRYKRALSDTGLDYQTLKNYAWVARKFPVSRRRDRLSFQHHAEVAGLADHEQEIWLNRAEQARWSRNNLRRELQASRRSPEASTAVFVLRMDVASDRQERWQAAADKSLCSFMDWAIRALDKAAETALLAREGPQ